MIRVRPLKKSKGATRGLCAPRGESARSKGVRPGGGPPRVRRFPSVTGMQPVPEAGSGDSDDEINVDWGEFSWILIGLGRASPQSPNPRRAASACAASVCM